MNKVMIAPRRYVQGPDVLKEAGDLIGAIGKKAAILWDDTVKGIVGDTFLSSLKEKGVGIVDIHFNGQSTMDLGEPFPTSGLGTFCTGDFTFLPSEAIKAKE